MAQLFLGVLRRFVRSQSKLYLHEKVSVRGFIYRPSIHEGIFFEELEADDKSNLSSTANGDIEPQVKNTIEIPSKTSLESIPVNEKIHREQTKITQIAKPVTVKRDEMTKVSAPVRDKSDRRKLENVASVISATDRYKYVPSIHEGIFFEEKLESLQNDEKIPGDTKREKKVLQKDSLESTHGVEKNIRVNVARNVAELVTVNSEKLKTETIGSDVIPSNDKYKYVPSINEGIFFEEILEEKIEENKSYPANLPRNVFRMKPSFRHLTNATPPENKIQRSPYSNSTSGAKAVAENNLLHIPVLVKIVVDMLEPKPGQVFVDMTFGAGGHTKALLDREEDIRIYALDRDPDAHALAVKFAESRPNVIPLLGRFSDLNNLLASQKVDPGSMDGILMDTGASSIQYNRADRGFSLSKNGPLDMRMDKNRIPQMPTAADVVNFADVSSLTQILQTYGDESMARHIARAIEDHRSAFGLITATKELADIVSRAYGEGVYKKDSLGRESHVATKTFMALRIFVNNELNELNNGLELAHHYLKPGGACAAITFHSHEDRIVKRLFHGINMDANLNMHSLKSPSFQGLSKEQLTDLTHKKWTPKNKSPIGPDGKELGFNPRSRSAKLRVAVKS